MVHYANVFKGLDSGHRRELARRVHTCFFSRTRAVLHRNACAHAITLMRAHYHTHARTLLHSCARVPTRTDAHARCRCGETPFFSSGQEPRTKRFFRELFELQSGSRPHPFAYGSYNSSLRRFAYIFLGCNTPRPSVATTTCAQLRSIALKCAQLRTPDRFGR